jgi:Helix-turn-helix domain
MSSEPETRPSSPQRARPRSTGDPGVSRPDPARYRTGGAAEAAELARVLGYDPDDLATWPGTGPGAPGTAKPAAEPGDAGQAGPAPETEELRVLTDAKAMRALAHPVRVALLDLFGYHDTLTATQASELLGESPANCAFHLRTLAKYGFVREAGGGRGRERPWEIVSRSMRITTQQPDPQAALAADELGRVMLDRWLTRARQVFGSDNRVPGWDHARGWTRSHVFLTPEETESLTQEMRRLLHQYEDRYNDPERRPSGALPVEWAIFASPIADWSGRDGDDGLAAGPDAPGAADQQ